VSALPTTIDAAYTRCEEITRREAKNFAYGIRLLPPDKRRAMSAIYALARRIDDIGDGGAPSEVKLADLATVRHRIASIRESQSQSDDGSGSEPVYVALADAARRFPIPLTAFDDLVDGCSLDAAGTTFETYDQLVDYCRKVAGSVGRLSLGVFGTTAATASGAGDAVELADDLGVALQLTNILRDVVEDRGMGRVYLPAEDVERFGCAPDVTGPRDAVGALVRFEAERARGWFARGFRLLPLLDHRSRACVGAMAGIYRRLLVRIDADPTAVLDRRVSLPAWEKAWVAARSLAGGRA
jgi:15-cis-phytoene synthase